MTVPTNNFVTKEEVENSYEFKLMKRILKREFPWIIDVKAPSDDEINKYNLIFLDIFIDPFLLQKEEGWPIVSYLKHYLSGGLGIHAPYTYQSSYLSTMFNVDRQETKEVQDDVESTMKSISQSNAIPQDLKLGKDRSLTVGSWIVPETKDIPSDAVFTDFKRTD